MLWPCDERWVRRDEELRMRAAAQFKSRGDFESTSALMIDIDLEAAYRATEYVVEPLSGRGQDADVDPVVLKIDSASQALRALHRRHGVDCSCFITACNPFSRPLDEESNLRRQEALAAELRRRSLTFLPGAGRHPSNGWPPEPSFLVLGLALEASKNLGRQYEQNAILWAGADAVPRLVMLV